MVPLNDQERAMVVANALIMFLGLVSLYLNWDNPTRSSDEDDGAKWLAVSGGILCLATFCLAPTLNLGIPPVVCIIVFGGSLLALVTSYLLRDRWELWPFFGAIFFTLFANALGLLVLEVASR